MLIKETKWPPTVAGRRSYGKCRLNHVVNLCICIAMELILRAVGRQ